MSPLSLLGAAFIAASSCWADEPLVRLEGLSDGDRIHVVEGYKDNAAFSPDGTIFAAALTAGIKLLTLADGKLLRALPVSALEIRFSKEGNTFCAFEHRPNDGFFVQYFEVSTGRVLEKKAMKNRWWKFKDCEPSSWASGELKLDDEFVLKGGGTVGVQSTVSGRIVKAIAIPGGSNHFLASPNRRYVVAVNYKLDPYDSGAGGTFGLIDLAKAIPKTKDETSTRLARILGQLKADPKSFQGFAELAAFYTRDGRHAQGLEQVQRLSGKKPTPAALFAVGALHYSAGRDQPAIEALSQSCRKDERAQTRILLGGARHRAGDVKGAIAEYTRALELGPGRSDALLGRGLAHFALRSGAAADDLEGAVSDYADKEVLAILKEARALRKLDQAMQADPKSPKPYRNRGAHFERSGELGRAAQDYLAASRHGALTSAEWTVVGLERIHSRHPSEAEPAFSKAVALDAKNHSAWYHLGLVATHSIDRTAHFLKAVKLNPDNDEYQKALKEAQNAYIAKYGSPRSVKITVDAEDTIRQSQAASLFNRAALSSGPDYNAVVRDRVDRKLWDMNNPFRTK